MNSFAPSESGRISQPQRGQHDRAEVDRVHEAPVLHEHVEDGAGAEQPDDEQRDGAEVRILADAAQDHPDRPAPEAHERDASTRCVHSRNVAVPPVGLVLSRHAHCDRRRTSDRAAPRARRPAGRVPPPPARGRPRPRRRPRARAVRAAHRLGKVGGVLPRHRAAARAGRRARADRLAAAGADAQPDRGGRAARDPGVHGQLDQPRRVGGGPRRCSRPTRSTCC